MSTTSSVIQRDATDSDADAIAAIYATYVRISPATFEEEAPDAIEMRSRMKRVQSAGLPWRVSVDADGAVTGYAYASPYRTRSAYRYTLENSVYVAPDRLRRGIGFALMR
ncbi:MAG: N-acetyltransferase family protein, partial [Burkholderiales bacterium]